MSNETAVQAHVRGRAAFGATAILAGFGMVLNLVLTALGTYPSTQTVPTLLGFNEPGLAGMPGRVFDFLSYFTVLSNILVAVVMAMLWRDPQRNGVVFRVLRMDALLMITVTGLIYWGVLAGEVKLQGLEYVTNTIEHTYPYGFIDVARYGYGSVLINIAGVAVFGVIIGFTFLGIDRLLSRFQHSAGHPGG